MIMSASVRTIGQTSIINLERHSCERVFPPCSSAHFRKKALQFIIVSSSESSDNLVALIPIGAGSREDERRRLDLVLTPKNSEELSGRKVFESTNTVTQIHEPR